VRAFGDEIEAGKERLSLVMRPYLVCEPMDVGVSRRITSRPSVDDGRENG
jgi:hypothetical protein